MSRFCPLFSSSSGNCTYIGSADGGILIDAGVSARRTVLALKDIGVDMGDIGAVFVTHEHSDHISGLRVLAGRHSLDVYTSAGTLNALESMGELTTGYAARVIPAEGVEVCGMHISAFATSHDSRESVGYLVEMPDSRRVAVATDTGFVTEAMMQALLGVDLVLLESNHDVRMLQNGPYPYYVKRRVLSDEGHLSNDTCAETIITLLQNGGTRFVLGHLSRENNHPELAMQTTRAALSRIGARENIDYILSVAGTGPSPRLTVF